MLAVSTTGYYKNHLSSVPNHNNDPTIPITIGNEIDSARAVAWMDTGYDDRCTLDHTDGGTYYTHIVNINKAYLAHLQTKGIDIVVNKQSYYTLERNAIFYKSER